MADMQFEWDEAKRISTIAKHGVDFEDAKLIFDGRPVLHAPSDHEGEDRWIAVGDLNGLLVSVVFTHRSGRIRNITARRAREDEKRRYNDAFSGGNDPPQE